LSWAVISLLIMVGLPFLASTVYYELIASDQYVSEFHFSVRSQVLTSAPPPTPGSPMSGTITTVANSAAPPDMISNYAVMDYINSPQAIDDLSAKLPLKSYFTTHDADWFSRLHDSATRERFNHYWFHMVDADYDEASGLAVVKVRAFKPADAYTIAKELENSAEKLVNTMEDRAREDSVRFAQKMVDNDTAKVEEINKKLFALRKASGTIDPQASFVTQNNQVALSLVQSLVQLRTQYAATLSQMHNPDAPTLRNLRDQIAATEQQLAETRADVGSSAKGSVLPAVVGEFEQTQLQMQLAQQALTASIANLEIARASAISQTLYIMSHVEARTPESAEYPKRLQMILLITFAGLSLWMAGSLITNTVRSHLN
jgi:capsular polysaccharide transport system permease protein